MIGVDGQYLLKFKIGKFDDFLMEGDLNEFTIIEEAGNVLPTFDTLFWLRIPDVVFYLNEGNALEVAFGKSKASLINTRLLIQTKEFVKAGAGAYLVRMKGIACYPEYLSDSRTRVIGPMSGIQAMSEVVGAWFQKDFNVSSSQDSQYWYQTGVSDRNFVSKLWMYSYLPNSYPAIGISCDGTFILRDVRLRAKQAYDWRLVPYVPTTDNEIGFGDYSIKSESGFYNQWMGYGKEKSLFDLETGQFSTATPQTFTPTLPIASKFDRFAGAGSRKDESGFTGSNVDSHYYSSYLQNLTNLAVASSTGVEISYVATQFKSIRVLDLVLLSDKDIRYTSQAAESQSGLYLVSRVTRTFSNRVIDTTLRLTRESLGQMKGDFK